MTRAARESGPVAPAIRHQRRPRERDRPIDPNSPFAKLAALKEQLAASRKDQLADSTDTVISKWCCLERQRLDKWLWHARVVKARTSAAALVEAGHVRINGVREKAPGHGVKAGDVLTIGLDRSVRVLKVTGFAERRGDASAARVLYEICRTGRNNYLYASAFGQPGPLKTAREGALLRLAAAEFLRYANHSKLTRFGVLDDLRRH